MIHSLLRRALLATALGLGVMAGPGRSAENPVPPRPMPMRPAESGIAPAVPTPAVVSESASCAAEAAPVQRRRLVSYLRPRVVVQAVHEHLPLGCYSHFNDYSCSSLHSERDFLFGSCRKFFGESCLKGPPASPVPGFDARTLTYTPPSEGAPSYVPAPGCRCR